MAGGPIPLQHLLRMMMAEETLLSTPGEISGVRMFFHSQLSSRQYLICIYTTSFSKKHLKQCSLERGPMIPQMHQNKGGLPCEQWGTTLGLHMGYFTHQ